MAANICTVTLGNSSNGGDPFADCVEDADIMPEDGDIATPNDDGGEEPRQGGRGRGRGKGGKKGCGKGKAKAAPSGHARVKWCPAHRSDDKIVRPNKAYCEDCNPDIEAMRRDAKASGKESKKMLDEHEKHAKAIDHPQGEELHKLHFAWKTEVGPSTGMPRIGTFKWMQYQDKYAKRQGSRSEVARVSVTQKEFVDKMEAKGTTKAWGLEEFMRRRNMPSFAPGICPDTGFPTVKMFEGPKDTDFKENFQETSATKSTKDIAYKDQAFAEQVAALSREAGSMDVAASVTHCDR